MTRPLLTTLALFFWTAELLAEQVPARERQLFNTGWRFHLGEPAGSAPPPPYDVRPDPSGAQDDRPADAMPTEAVKIAADAVPVLKPWILPSANPFIADPARRHAVPAAPPPPAPAAALAGFDDSGWRLLDLPHDWAIAGPWLEEGPYGGMGRLPSWGTAWYRKNLAVPASDAGRSVFLEIEGAMSYATVWCNGRLVGGWPYGYASWRVDLTPALNFGENNQIAIHIDNPPASSRWYPGAGLYRDVWLVKTSAQRVSPWGVFVRSREVSPASATIDLSVTLENRASVAAEIEVATELFALDAAGRRERDEPDAAFPPQSLRLDADTEQRVDASLVLPAPRLWGPPPAQKPHRYLAVTTLRRGGVAVDRFETRFGIRELRFDPDAGLHVNGERIRLQGVNLHHDLGALGAAFNVSAARRQLEILREMGCNAVRVAHNPPATAFLELADELGFLVVNEIFDCWARKKTPLDFHLIFPDWSEPDLRAFIRRDRNHPSVVMWSIGNEVGEQYTGEDGAVVARRLHANTREEDPTRPTTNAMNWAKPDMPLPAVMDIVSLNYQGEGIRDTPAHEGIGGIRTAPQYAAFRLKFPDKMIVASETAAALSTRGEYLFPVAPGASNPVRDGLGGDGARAVVSAYELHAADFGSSADKVFAAQDRHPFVAGEFVWSGWDYLGEPTPYYSARSSYFGIIDLAGFPKDRFYLYQSRWRPDLPMAHILPHWTWPERVGQVTPVHVFTSGDEAELFLNGRSLGRKKKAAYEYRLRWDDVVYEPGKLEVVAYKAGQRWAEAAVATAGEPAALAAESDRAALRADGLELAFVTVRVLDASGRPAPRANHPLVFTLEGPGEIVATDNGDPTSFEPFQAPRRRAFNGLCLVILRARPGAIGDLRLTAVGDGLSPAVTTVKLLAP